MSGVKWPVIIEDVDRDRIAVHLFDGTIRVGIFQGLAHSFVALTPAQSATLRAALEAAEQEMS